jgi:hypothetical protein
MFVVLSFLAYSAFCYRVIYRDGADVLEGWKPFFVFDWLAATLTAAELRFYIGLSWLFSLVATLIELFARSGRWPGRA